MSDKPQNGFIVYDQAEFFRVTLFNLSPDVPLENVDACPACKMQLSPVCALVGSTGKSQIRTGVCDNCGYLGYMDRPAKEWMLNFYEAVWDKHIAKTVDEVRAQPPLSTDKKPSRPRAASLIEGLKVPREAVICEIGSGYGSVLKHLMDAGYANVFGTENSVHRARVVHDAFGIPVFTGNFEGAAVQEKLRGVGPVDVFFTHHVFEHVYDPEEVVRAIAENQKSGGILIIALPDADGEHAGYISTYLPHLHSFTKESLELLLNKYDYYVTADASLDRANMILAARKGDVAYPIKYMRRGGYRALAIEKLRRGLGLDKLTSPGYSRYRWLVSGSGYDDAEIVPLSFAAWYAQKAVGFVKAKLGRYTATHAALIKPLTVKYTDAPIEIQFPGNITFLMK